MDWLKVFYGLIGGLGLFLFGMKLMSEGLQKSAGKSLKTILEKLTSNRVVGTVVGILVTAIIQSSSATTVMVVGFVNAGLMNLAQALSVVLGANIGTTITAQLIAFKITKFALPAIGIGVFIKMFSRKGKWIYFGEILLGFGLLFYGMELMSHSLVPLRKAPEFSQMFVYFSHNPIMAALAGTLLTVVVQSSSATLGITIALAGTGLIDFYAAAALVLGENIGTTITANLAAIGTNRVAKQAAFGHFLFNFFGVAYMLILLTYFTEFIEWFTPGDANFVAADGNRPYIARHIANLHTSFNIINTIVFLPLLGVLATVAEKVIKIDKPDDTGYRLVHLNDMLINTPPIAVQQARKEVERMSSVALEMLKLSKVGLLNRDTDAIKKIYEMEDTVDLLEKDISVFLVKLFQMPVSERSSMLIDNMLHVLHDIEKIADHSENIARFTEKMLEKEIIFSDEALEEAVRIFDTAIRFAENVIRAYNKYDEGLKELDTNDEDSIDLMRREYKSNHMSRLNQGMCTVDAGIIFVDILNNIEKVGDHTFNISQVVTGAHKKTHSND